MTEETDPHAVLGVARDADARAIDEAYAARAATAAPEDRAALDAAYAALLAARRRAEAVGWSLRPAEPAAPPADLEPEPAPELADAPATASLPPAVPVFDPPPEETIPEPDAEEAIEDAVIEPEAEPEPEPAPAADAPVSAAPPPAAPQPDLDVPPPPASEPEPPPVMVEPDPEPAPPPPSPPVVTFRADGPGRPLPEQQPAGVLANSIVRTLLILVGGGLVMLLAGMALASLIAGHRAPPPPAKGKANLTAAAVTAPPGSKALTAGRMVSWEEKDGTVTYAGEGLVLEVRAAGGKGQRRAVVKVTGPGGKTIEIPGEVGFDEAAVSVGVGRLNNESTAAEVLVRSYTGGAHCCTATKAAQLYSAGWTVFDLGQRDGDDLTSFPGDLDGDGVADFLTVDNRFLYAFESYAGSWAPPMVFNLAGGAFKDVSADPRFAAVFRDDLEKAGKACDGGSNGACAGYVAIAARLGQAPAAWRRMLAHYNRGSDWEAPKGCRRKLPQNLSGPTAKCPAADELAFASYPEALRWFLGDAGYMPAAWIPPRPGAAGPSFDCRKAATPAQQAVCADPSLAARDRELTLQYNRALLLVPDVDAVRNAERGFLAGLANQSDPGVLAEAYDRRIAELKGQIGR